MTEFLSVAWLAIHRSAFLFDAAPTQTMVQSKLDKRLEDIDHNLLDLSRHLVAASSLTEERLTAMATVLDKVLMRLEQSNVKDTHTSFF